MKQAYISVFHWWICLFRRRPNPRIRRRLRRTKTPIRTQERRLWCHQKTASSRTLVEKPWGRYCQHIRSSRTLATTIPCKEEKVGLCVCLNNSRSGARDQSEQYGASEWESDAIKWRVASGQGNGPVFNTVNSSSFCHCTLGKKRRKFASTTRRGRGRQ